ncbi:MAG: KH domain-containing protein [Myxococcaceae bacterium]
MSELPSEPQAVGPAPEAQPAAPKVDKREQAERVIGDIVRLMGLPARLEVKEVLPVKAAEGKGGIEGGISVALYFEGEVPGVQPGRRSHLVEAIQFLANKIVNRPQTERKWISVGVGGHPEPRPAQAPRGQGPAAPRPPPAAPAAAPAPGRREGRGPRQPRAEAPARAPQAAAAAPAVAGPPSEETMEVPPDPAVEALGRALLEKAAKFGRYYAVAPAKPEDRARMLKGAKGLAGAQVKVEGEGRNRRLVFVPDKPAPMPKKAMPDYGDEEA